MRGTVRPSAWSREIERTDGNMKKLVAVLLVLAMALALCGCDSRDYKKAKELMEEGEYEQAQELLDELEDYEDSAELAMECRYQRGLAAYETGDYATARELFLEIPDYKDAAEQTCGCTYQIALQDYADGRVKEAVEALSMIFDYPGARDAMIQIMLDEMTNKYLPEISAAQADQAAYIKTWTNQFVRNYNNARAGQNIDIPKVDMEDPDIISMMRHIDKAEEIRDEYLEIFNDEVMSRCDEDMQNFISTFKTSSEEIHEFFRDPSTFFVNVLLYIARNESVNKAMNPFTNAINAMQDAAEKLSQ